MKIKNYHAAKDIIGDTKTTIINLNKKIYLYLTNKAVFLGQTAIAININKMKQLSMDFLVYDENKSLVHQEALIFPEQIVSINYFLNKFKSDFLFQLFNYIQEEYFNFDNSQYEPWEDADNYDHLGLNYWDDYENNNKFDLNSYEDFQPIMIHFCQNLNKKERNKICQQILNVINDEKNN